MTCLIYRIVLFHLGLVTFRIRFRKGREIIIFIVSGFGGRVHDSQNQYHLSVETPGYSKQVKKNPETLSETYFVEISTLSKSKVAAGLTKTGPINPDEAANKILESLDVGATYIKKHEMWFEHLEYGINILPNIMT